VSGRVQGVGFRFHAAREASGLGVGGWVRNELDGTVLAHLEGPEEAVEAMLGWCHLGPPAARVTGVEVSDVEPTGARSFEIGH